MLAGLLRTQSPLCSLCFQKAIRPGTSSSFPLHGWWTGQMACGGMWIKSFTFVRSSLVAFLWAGTSLKLNASNVSSGTIWVRSIESSCRDLEEHALGGSCIPSGTCSVGPCTAMKLSPHCWPHTLLLLSHHASICPTPLLLPQPIHSHTSAPAQWQAPRIFSQEKARVSLCIPSRAACKVREITNWTS